MNLSPSAESTSGLATGSIEDRQVMADAIVAKSRFIVTTDVDDFAVADLQAHAMSAVNPDYFMAVRFTEHAYCEGVGTLAAVAKKPRRAEAEVHAMLGRRHPLLVARFASLYDTEPVPADQDQASVIFRGVICVRCGRRLHSEETRRVGLCSKHGAAPRRG